MKNMYTLDEHKKAWQNYLSANSDEDTQLPFGFSNVPLSKKQTTFGALEIEKKENLFCIHDYVNVGFHFDKWVCKVCDKEKV